MQLVACTNRQNEIRKCLVSNDPDSLVMCAYMIKARDTEFVDDILLNPYDPRITLALRHNGQSVYQAKMKALQRLSGLNPPRPITYKRDSQVVAFYQHWAKVHGYLD